MDTVKDVVNSARNAIFGNSTEQSGSEPVSGRTGSGTVDDPYDQGNLDDGDGSAPQDKAPSASNNTTPTNPTDTTSHTMSSQSTGDPSTGQQPVQKQEGADRPTEAPTNPAEDQAIKETKQAAETTQQADTNDTNDQQQQDSSPGNKDAASQMTGEVKHPRTEEERQEMAAKGQLPKIPGDRSGEPLHIHGSDDANADPNAGPEEEEPKPDRSASVGQEGGGEHGKEEGTGSKYVRSTGMAADGGDFDATKPGAGREANRLMEEKGMHKLESGGDGPGVGKQQQQQPPSEPSKVEKLKEKLHIGTGKHGNEQAV